MNSLRFLRSTARSRSSSAPNAIRLGARPLVVVDRRRWGGGAVVGGHSRSSFPVRLMKTVSRVGSPTDRSVTSKPASLGGVDDARAARPSRRVTPSCTVAVQDGGAGRRRSTSSREHAAASASRSPSADDRTIVSAPTERLSSAGVSSARIRPWSMIADPVAELVGLLHVVGGEQDRLPARRGARRGSPTARCGSAGRGRPSARRGTARPAGASPPAPPSAAAPCRPRAPAPARRPAR